MARTIVIDEFHLTISARSGLAEATYVAIRDALDEPAFRVALRRAVVALTRQWPSLRKVTVRVSR